MRGHDDKPSQPDPSQTARMPALQRTSGADDDYAVAAPPPSPMRSPLVFLAGLLIGLLVIGGGYLLISAVSENDDSATTPASSSATSGESADESGAGGSEPGDSVQSAANGSFGTQTDSESSLGGDEHDPQSAPQSMPGSQGEDDSWPEQGDTTSGQGGPGGACKVSSMPKSTGGQIAQEVTIECAEPTTLKIEPKGPAVIEHDGKEYDSAFTVCADEVTFVVTGGGYSWDRGEIC